MTLSADGLGTDSPIELNGMCDGAKGRQKKEFKIELVCEDTNQAKGERKRIVF
ncbi:MAG: hypothetical protein ACKVOQ_22735 [Cyclobacteriaceae bacterium]